MYRQQYFLLQKALEWFPRTSAFFVPKKCYVCNSYTQVQFIDIATIKLPFTVRPDLASYPGHVGGGKSGLVSTVCACVKNPMISWGIVYHRLQTVNLYRILVYSSEARPSRVYPANMAGKSEDFDKALKFTLCYWKGRFHVESRAAGCDQRWKTYSCGYPRDLVSPSATRLCRLFSTTSTVTVEPAVVVA